ncbi:MAG: NADH-quinone oxidoreductase subunit J [Deltaproteobacteria bacterium]|nr:NADH-quinone oxidoreductase subunit J [Deltaproteobacteria bacterium]
MVETLFFFLFAALAVVSAVMVISFRNPVHSVISLIICFFQIACLFLLLRAPFIAGAQIFVYVGAIMIFFVFAVFLLDIRTSMAKEKFSKWIVLGVPIALFFLIEIIALIAGGTFGQPSEEVTDISKLFSIGQNTEALGRVLFTKYLLPFEIISVVLLIGFVGAVVLTVKPRKED